MSRYLEHHSLSITTMKCQQDLGQRSDGSLKYWYVSMFFTHEHSANDNCSRMYSEQSVHNTKNTTNEKRKSASKRNCRGCKTTATPALSDKKTQTCSRSRSQTYRMNRRPARTGRAARTSWKAGCGLPRHKFDKVQLHKNTRKQTKMRNKKTAKCGA